MRIVRMKASFGGLRNRELALGEGLNIIEAPNEGGKSTWSAFLRAMLYGVNTKERDRQGYIAEKNRYQPWGGGPMEGSVELIWQGQSITLRRSAKGSTPFGQFEAVYTDTGAPVPGLTGANAGEVLRPKERSTGSRPSTGCWRPSGTPIWPAPWNSAGSGGRRPRPPWPRPRGRWTIWRLSTPATARRRIGTP